MRSTVRRDLVVLMVDCTSHVDSLDLYHDCTHTQFYDFFWDYSHMHQLETGWATKGLNCCNALHNCCHAIKYEAMYSDHLA